MKTKGNSIIVQPYLYFNGRCEEALEFYRKALGAKVTMLMRYKECPEPGGCPRGAGDKAMHASFDIGGTTLFASDGQCKGRTRFEGFSLSLTLSRKAGAGKFFAALADGGQVQMPLAKTFFSPCFGMVTDKFGLLWMILVMPQETGEK